MSPPRGTGPKRPAAERHLAELTAEQLGVATASSIVVAPATQGLSTSAAFAGRILSEWRWDHRPPRRARRR